MFGAECQVFRICMVRIIRAGIRRSFVSLDRRGATGEARMLADIIASGVMPRKMSLLRAEALAPHRVAERKFLLQFIPENSTGAEIGVFTGLFSSVLAAERKISKVTFVDPWW